MGEMETTTILSGFGKLRRGVAIAAVVAALGAAAPALAQPQAPSPAPGASLIHRVVWRWNGYRWVWVVPGPVYPPAPVVRPGLRWIPGHWVWGPYGRRWIPAHWG